MSSTYLWGMSNWRWYILLISLAILSLSSCDDRPKLGYSQSGQKVMQGDSIAWAQLDYDDTEWGHEDDHLTEEVFWSRIKVKIPPTQTPLRHYGITVVGTGAYEAYWDGVYLGRNGRLAIEGQSEIPGTYHWHTILPDSLLSPGEHVLASRITKTYLNGGQHQYLFFDEFYELANGPLQVAKFMFMIAGALIITGIYFFFLYVTEPRDFALLTFSVICLAFMALLLLEHLKSYYFYAYPFQKTRLEIIGYLHFSLTILIPLFFLLLFEVPWRWWVLLAVVSTVIYLDVTYHDKYDHVARYYTRTTWVYAMLIVGYAAIKAKKGAYWIIISLTIGFLMVRTINNIDINYVASYDISLFLAFALLVVTMIYVLTSRRRDVRLAYEASLVRSERLKNELLRKNIRPHFIMNTLTSLIDWVEEQPKEGVRFIHALADEFEILNTIADEKLIPVEQELRLCENHLRVMGYRKEVDYEWTTHGVDEEALIPPAIIHTGLENGVTHSLPNADGKVVFALDYQQTTKGEEYRLQTIAPIRPSTNDRLREGTGSRYIKARLQESYQDRWSYISQPTANGWEMIIKIQYL